VVEPHLNGPGGEVPILLWSDGRPRVICGQGPAPRAATIAAYRERGLDLVPAPARSPLACRARSTPGCCCLRDFGTLTPRQVLRYAIGYALDGFPAVPRIAETIAAVEHLFRDEWPTSAALWLPAPAPGTRMRNPLLGETFGRIVAAAEAGRRRREDADRRRPARLARGLRRRRRSPSTTTASSPRRPGRLPGDHRGAGQPRLPRLDGVQDPAVGQGPVLLQQLALLDGFDLDAMAPAERIHTVVECAKLAFADRDAFYGDSAPVPLDELLARATRASAARSSARGVGRPSPRTRRPDPAGAPRGGPARRRRRADARRHLPPRRRRPPRQPGLRHAERRLAAELAGDPGPRLLPRHAGADVLAHRRLRELAGPGRRPRTTLTPSLAVHEDGTRLAWGTPGGDQQDQWSLQLFLNHAVHGRNLQESIDAPAFHTSHLTSSFYPREVSLAGSRWRSASARTRSPTCAAAATTCRSRRHGRSGA
jgi:gamma-glutamyltranspeptidase/glutathione hydrolase